MKAVVIVLVCVLFTVHARSIEKCPDCEREEVYGHIIHSDSERLYPTKDSIKALQHALAADNAKYVQVFGSEQLRYNHPVYGPPPRPLKISQGLQDEFIEQRVNSDYELLPSGREISSVMNEDAYEDWKMDSKFTVHGEKNTAGVRRLYKRSVSPLSTNKHNVRGGNSGPVSSVNDNEGVDGQFKPIPSDSAFFFAGEHAGDQNGAVNSYWRTEDLERIKQGYIPSDIFSSREKLEGNPSIYRTLLAGKIKVLQNIRKVLLKDHISVLPTLPGRPIKKVLGVIANKLAQKTNPNTNPQGTLQFSTIHHENPSAGSPNPGLQSISQILRKAVRLGPLSVQVGLGRQ